MVAGDHHDADAGVLAAGHRLHGFRAWRIDDADDAQQRQPGFDVGML